MFEIKIFSKSNSKDFFAAALNIYKNDNNWVCPLNQEIDKLFDPEFNKVIKNGNSCRWILYQDSVPVGRIIAFWTEFKSKKTKPYSGGIGFFECINSQDAANLLFDAAKNWLKSEGMQTMDACTVPSENINYWGVLIDGFEQQGFGMTYNPPYYKELFKNYGFQIYYEQYSYHVDLTKPFNERHEIFANRIIESGEFEFKHLDYNHTQKFVEDSSKVFNDVWSHFHADYIPIKSQDYYELFMSVKQFINPKFVWFVYKDNNPIGMCICFPDINQVIKPFKGKLTLVNKIKFALNLKKVTRARLIAFGVHPDYHRKGVASPLFLKLINELRNAGIKELEMSWVGDYNPTVSSIYKHLGNSYLAKTHATFRYMIDKNFEFKRFTNEIENPT